jgi:PRTRC genetic system protein C
MNMSNLKAEALLREFHYNGVRIPDPGPELTVEQVRDLLFKKTPVTEIHGKYI